MSTEKVTEFEQRFSELIRHVETAQDNIRAGRVPNLHSIEADVAKLCKQVESSTPEIAQQVQPIMGELISRLDALAQYLMDYKQQMAGKS